MNLDDLQQIKIQNSFTGMKQFYMPKTILTADAVISLPKMKTHHWVGATCSMKNLFGTVPGRKYGLPKNLLHAKGIPRWILDLQDIVKPKFAIVDAIIAMEGDGPINGTASKRVLSPWETTWGRRCHLHSHYVLTLEDIPYIRLAGEVVGNVNEDAIKIVGHSIDSVKQSFAKPLTMIDKSLAANAGRQSG